MKRISLAFAVLLSGCGHPVAERAKDAVVTVSVIAAESECAKEEDVRRLRLNTINAPFVEARSTVRVLPLDCDNDGQLDFDVATD